MKIEIGEKQRPFSHVAGTRCVVPGSDWIAQIFPTLLKVEGFLELPIHVTGPVKEFTVQTDLERGCLFVWGISSEGYFKYRLEAREEGLSLALERAPKEGILIGEKTMERHEKRLIASNGKCSPPKRRERLSLGSFKAQDWDCVWRRMDLKEIAPVLFLLGQQVPETEKASGPVADLLPGSLHLFIQAGFSGLLVPRLEDDQFQGIASVGKGTGNRLSLLKMGYLALRSMLIAEENPYVKILPSLPKEWDAGRAVGLFIEGLGTLDLEWSRGAIQRMVFHSTAVSEPIFLFSKGVGSFRLNGKRTENGERIVCEPLKQYEFDRFQK